MVSPVVTSQGAETATEAIHISGVVSLGDTDANSNENSCQTLTKSAGAISTTGGAAAVQSYSTMSQQQQQRAAVNVRLYV